jgi:hypothetical protein
LFHDPKPTAVICAIVDSAKKIATINKKKGKRFANNLIFHLGWWELIEE